MKRSFTAVVVTMVAFMMLASLSMPMNRSFAANVRMPFDDIGYNYATAAIVNMSNNNIIAGTGTRTFEPDKPITRAEFATMLDRLLGIEPVFSAIQSFEDVPRTAWYYQWVQAAVHLNLVSGTSETRFEPNRTVTREEAAVMITRAFKQQTVSLSAVPDSIYEDQGLIHSWALPSIYRLQSLGIMEGDKRSFRPRESITRQDAAVLMNRAWTRSGWSQQIRQIPASTIQLGWQYGQTTEQFERQVMQSTVNTLSPRWFYLGSSGKLENGIDASLLTWAHAKGKKVWAMVGNHSDSKNTHQMLADSSQRQAFIRKLTDAVKQNGIDGLNIDFEGMLPEDRDAFTAFVQDLHTEMTKIPSPLSVNVSPDFGTDWTEVFDYRALGKNAEYVVLMGYDEHWGGSQNPGPVSSLPWLQQGVEALLKQVPAGKIILALPLYTRNWAIDGNGNVQSMDWSLVQQNSTLNSRMLKTSWDESLGQYYAQFTEKSSLNRIWVEDGRSLSRKLSLGQQWSIAGYGYWYMGGESVDIWTSLRNAMKFGAYDFS